MSAHGIEAAVDDSRFDDLARELAMSSTRRTLVRSTLGLIAGGIGLTGRRSTGAATRRSVGEICRKSGDCVSNRCGPADSTGRRRCLCSTPADCPPATVGSQCLGAICSPAGVCGIEITVGAACDDGNLCTVNDQCQANGSCSGTQKNCDDNNACTVDSCDAQTGKCVNTPVSCSDNNACTTDTCNPGTGCVFTPVTCNDGNVCTVDTCDSQIGCVFTPIQCGEVPDGNGGFACCGNCTGPNRCCSNGVCGPCPTCALCPHGPMTATLADSTVIDSQGGAVCLSPCTSNADCGCGEVCAATFKLCLPGTPSVDCATNSGGSLPAGAYCAVFSYCNNPD